jgi:hypothetical protein
MADKIVSWGGIESKSTSGLGVTGSLNVLGSSEITRTDGDGYLKIGNNGGGIIIENYNRTDLTLKSTAIMTTRGTGVTFRNSKGEPNGAILGVIGSGTTSSTTSLLVQNANATSSLQIYDNGNITIGLGTTTFSSIGSNGNAPSSSIYFDNYISAHQVHHQIITRAAGQGSPYNYLQFPTAYGGTYGFIGAGAGVTLALSNSGSTAFMNYNHNGITTNASNAPITIDPSARTLTYGGGSNDVNHLAPYQVILKGNRPLSSGLDAGGDVYILGGLPRSGSSGISGSIYLTGGTINAQNTLYISGSRVGIGTSTPNFTLDVSGSSEFVGNMIITGSVIISGSATTGEGSYNTVPSTLYVKNSIAVFTDLDNTASINLKGSSTNRGMKGIYFYHSNKSAWIESQPVGGGDIGGLRFGAGGNSVLDFGAYGFSAAFSVPITAPSYGGIDNNSGTHYYNFNSSELAVRIASTRLGSSGRGNLKFQLSVAGGNASDSDTFFYVPGTNKNISINSTTTDLGATLGVKGSGTTSSTTSFLVQNTNASSSLQILDDGQVRAPFNRITNSSTQTIFYGTNSAIWLGLIPTGTNEVPSLYDQNSNKVIIGNKAYATNVNGGIIAIGMNHVNDSRGTYNQIVIGNNSSTGASGGYRSDYNIVLGHSSGQKININGSANTGNNIVIGNFSLSSSLDNSMTNTTVIGNNIQYSGSDSVVFEPSQNVYIGTPLGGLYKLNVSGSGNFTNNLTVTGSVLNQPLTLPTASGTASMDCSKSNFFNLTLSGSYTLFLSASNIQPGQTINLRVTQPATSGSLNYGSQFKFAGGIPYSASATSSTVDIISFISFDTTTLYGSAIKNLS